MPVPSLTEVNEAKKKLRVCRTKWKKRNQDLVVEQKIPVDTATHSLGFLRTTKHAFQCLLVGVLGCISADIPHAECHGTHGLDDHLIDIPLVEGIIAEANIFQNAVYETSGVRCPAGVPNATLEVRGEPYGNVGHLGSDLQVEFASSHGSTLVIRYEIPAGNEENQGGLTIFNFTGLVVAAMNMFKR